MLILPISTHTATLPFESNPCNCQSIAKLTNKRDKETAKQITVDDSKLKLQRQYGFQRHDIYTEYDNLPINAYNTDTGNSVRDGQNTDGRMDTRNSVMSFGRNSVSNILRPTILIYETEFFLRGYKSLRLLQDPKVH